MVSLWHNRVMKSRRQAGNIIPATLAASAIMAFLTSMSFFMVSLSTEEVMARMDLSPTAAVVNVDGSFTTSLYVEATTPVNAFTGVLTFDPNKLQVEKIDYNTSIADLWAEAPWYKNGDGTIHFAGGTTKAGGFSGRGNLLTITFHSIAAGEAPVRIKDAAVLRHDGLGTEAILDTPIDGLFTVVGNTKTVATIHDKTAVIVRDPALSGDLNDDGIVSIGDISIFFTYLTTSDPRGDLNKDNRISTSDLSILISQI